MLISLKAFNPNFLHTNMPEEMLNCAKGIDCSVTGVRRAIINSKKFIVGQELIPYNDKNESVTDGLNKIFHGDLDSGASASIIEKYKGIWSKFAKLPYPAIFIENSGMGILLQEYNGGILGLVIHQSGFIEYCRFFIRHGEEFLFSGYMNKTLQDKIENGLCTITVSDMKAMNQRIGFWCFMVLNALTYINAKNVSIEAYKMSKSEAKRSNLPNVMVRQYDYHVVNIFHKKVVYEKLADVEAFSNSETTSHIRAHMVRGHFKQRGSGLYWWNPFLRCKKNQGFVDKDYIVH